MVGPSNPRGASGNTRMNTWVGMIRSVAAFLSFKRCAAHSWIKQTQIVLVSLNNTTVTGRLQLNTNGYAMHARRSSAKTRTRASRLTVAVLISLEKIM